MTATPTLEHLEEAEASRPDRRRIFWLFAIVVVAAAVVPFSPVAGIGLAGALAIALRPDLGLAALVFLAWSRASDALIQSVGAPSLVEPFVAFLLAVVLFRKMLFDEPWGDVLEPTLFYGFFILLAIASALYADYPLVVIGTLNDHVKDGVFLVLILMMLTSPERLRLVVWAIIGAATLLSFAAAFQYVTGTFENTYWGLAQTEVQHIVGEVNSNRAGGPGIGPNGFAQILLVAVPLAFERAVRDPWRWLRPVALVAGVIIMAGVVLTFSRQALLAVAVMVVAAALLMKIKIRWLVLAGTLLVVLVLQFAPDSYVDRLATLGDLLPGSDEQITAEGSYRGRLSEYIVGVQMFADHPVAGVGLGNYNAHYQEYARPLGLESRRTGRSPHSLYLELASEQGVIGLLWFLALTVVSFKGLAWSRRRAAELGHDSVASLVMGLQIALIGYLTTSTFRHLAFTRYFWVLFAIVLATPFVVRSLDSGSRTGEATRTPRPQPVRWWGSKPDNETVLQ